MNAKIFFEGQIRRTTLDVAPTFDSLRKKLSNLFDEPSIVEREKAFNIKYQDEDGDWIDFSTDEELSDAIKLVKSYKQVIHIQITRREEKKEESKSAQVPEIKEENPLQFVQDLIGNVNLEQFKPFINQLESVGFSSDPNQLVSLFEKFFCPEEAKEEKKEEEKKEEEKEVKSEEKEEEKAVHFAMCDKCRKRIVGTRHKCNDCHDYDLCENCIGNKDSFHPSHSFRAIERPENPFMSAKVVSSDVIHHAICDSCQDRIVGLRFKCETCPDYDLCGMCFQNQEEIHPAHGFKVIEKGASNPCCRKRECVFAPSQPVAQEQVPYDNSIVDQPESSDSDDEEFEEPEAPVEIRESQIQPGMTREKLQDALKQLQEMGFSDREKNVRLIIQNQGDVVTTIMSLLNQ